MKAATITLVALSIAGMSSGQHRLARTAFNTGFKTTELLIAYTHLPVRRNDELWRGCVTAGISWHRQKYEIAAVSHRLNVAGVYAPDLKGFGGDLSIELYWFFFNFRPSLTYYHSDVLRVTTFSPRIGIGWNASGGGFSFQWCPQIRLTSESELPLKSGNFVFTMYLF